MNILSRIIEAKSAEVSQRKSVFPVSVLESLPLFDRQTRSLKESIMDNNKTGIIAEFKRRSPSKGPINLLADVEKVVMDYEYYGASAISVLTDDSFFGGTSLDLEKTANAVRHIPVLRKEFIIDEYQVIESKAIGADAILLIASVLPKEKIVAFTSLAHSFGLEVLLEIHEEEEIKSIPDRCDVLGVNNRDLKTFSVDIQRAVRLFKKLPEHVTKISESGIDTPLTYKQLVEAGYDGALIGALFMKDADPGASFFSFVSEYAKNGTDFPSH